MDRNRVVFAMANLPVVIDPVTGARGRVAKGSHWPADDPVVLAHPEVFSTDPRYGLNYSVEPDGWDAPEGEPPVEQATRAPGEKRQTRRG
jgi:hypothetical protein